MSADFAAACYHRADDDDTDYEAIDAARHDETERRADMAREEMS